MAFGDPTPGKQVAQTIELPALDPSIKQYRAEFETERVKIASLPQEQRDAAEWELRLKHFVKIRNEKPLSKTEKQTVSYLLFLPTDYDATSEKQWPLLLSLHGSSLRGDDINKVKNYGLPKLLTDPEKAKDWPFVTVSPQCPAGLHWSPLQLNLLLDEIEKAYSIDKNRIYVTGVSLGGFGTWNLLYHFPDRFAAGVPVCNGFDPAVAERFVDIPIWAFHGAKDTTVKVEWSSNMVDAIKAKGGNNIKLTIYPDLGHTIWAETYGNPELYRWLLTQKKDGPDVGRYRFQDAPTGKTINVWFSRPKDFNAKTPILIVMHGMNRDAKGYRNVCMAFTEKHRLMLLVPEFTDEDFPGDVAYNHGNVFPKINPKDDPDTEDSETKRPNPKEQWTYGVIDRLFDDFVKREQSEQKRYYLYGHSAGAQFAHRLPLFVPEAKFKMVVPANAGAYTVPDQTADWPYGVRKTPVDDRQALERYFASPLFVLAGEADTDPEAKNLARSARADKQGTNRLDRAKFFFESARKTAETWKVPFAWKLRTVPEASHANRKMFEVAVEIIAEDVKQKPEGGTTQ